MLQTIKLTHLRSGEFIQFFNDVLSICTKADIDTLNIKDQVDALNLQLTSIKNSFGKERGSNITHELKEIDSRRDKCITGIRMVAEAYTYHFDENMASLAGKLLQKIDSFGSSIARQNYQAETSIINKLYQSFETEPEINNALALLKLNLWAEKLKQENTLFNQRFLDRIDESAKESTDKFAELRNQVTTTYRTLCEHIKAHATLKGKETYLPLIDPINSLIDNYMTIIKRRSQKINEVEIPKNEESIS